MQVRSPGGCCTFDMKQQRRDLQMQGFHTLLQNQNVVKVLHDCRPAAAALFYQKSITICNVFDTQVTEHAVSCANIYHCRGHNWFGRLRHCCKLCLPLPSASVINDKQKRNDVEALQAGKLHHGLTFTLCQ